MAQDLINKLLAKKICFASDASKVILRSIERKFTT